MLLFIFLRKNSIITGNTEYLPYPLYIFLSLILWQTFAGIIRGSCNILERYGNLKTLSFSRKALIYGNAMVSLFITCFMLCIFIILSLLLNVPPSIGILGIPGIVLFIILYALGIAKIIAIFSAVTRDVIEGLTVFLMFLMFVTPAIYTEFSKYDKAIELVNPLHVFIKTAHLFWSGHFQAIPAIFYWHCFFAVIMFFLGSYFFRKTIHIALERI